MTSVAFVGLGNMGLPMAKNLVAAGFAVRGYDLDQGARDALAASGGVAASSLEDALVGADAVLTMLPEGRHVRAVYRGERGVLAAAPNGALLIDCSTIDVETARAVASEAQNAGFAMVDAPVSGGVGGAEAGALTFMLGGEEAARTRAEPILAPMAGRIVATGGPGSGQAAKICNNMLLGVSMIGVCEAFVLARKLGLSERALYDVASTSSGQCWSLTSYCPVPGPVPQSPANRNYVAGFTAAMMAKDLALAQDAARIGGAATPLGAMAAQLYNLFTSNGCAEVDFSGMILMLEAELGQAKAKAGSPDLPK